MGVEGLSVILAHYQRGTSIELDVITKDMRSWWPLNDILDAGPLPTLWRGEVLQLAAVLPIHPDVVTVCEQLSTTTEGLIALLAVELSVPAQPHGVMLPDDLT